MSDLTSSSVFILMAKFLFVLASRLLKSRGHYVCAMYILAICRLGPCLMKFLWIYLDKING